MKKITWIVTRTHEKTDIWAGQRAANLMASYISFPPLSFFSKEKLTFTSALNWAIALGLSCYRESSVFFSLLFLLTLKPDYGAS
jgi:hypothetical protein